MAQLRPRHLDTILTCCTWRTAGFPHHTWQAAPCDGNPLEPVPCAGGHGLGQLRNRCLWVPAGFAQSIWRCECRYGCMRAINAPMNAHTWHSHARYDPLRFRRYPAPQPARGSAAESAQQGRCSQSLRLSIGSVFVCSVSRGLPHGLELQFVVGHPCTPHSPRIVLMTPP